MSLFDFNFSGNSEPIGGSSTYFQLPDFNQPTNYVDLASMGPSYTAPDSGGFLSSVGNLFSSAGTGISNTVSSGWDSVAGLFGGSTPANSSQAASKTGASGAGLLSTVGSLFQGATNILSGAVKSANANAKAGAQSAVGFGGNLVGKFMGGIVQGAGLPTILVILAVVGVVAYVWAKRI